MTVSQPTHSPIVDTSTDLLRTRAPGNYSEYASFLYEVNSILCLTVSPVLLVLGCFGNVMTIVVMRALRASDSTACLSVYFTALALSDLCLLVTSVLTKWPEAAFGVSFVLFHDLVCATFYYLVFLASMTSPWLLMAMTCQRMLSVMVPHRVGVVCTVKRARIITVILTVAACAVCLPVLLNSKVVDVGHQRKMCLNTDQSGAFVLFLAVLVSTSVIPSLFLLVANCVLIRGVQRSVKMSRVLSGRGDGHQPPTTSSLSAKVSSMTVTLILTSVAFFLLTTPICVYDIYVEEMGFYRGLVQGDEVRAKLTLSETGVYLSWISNSVINFYIYILSGRKFRRETKRCLCITAPEQKGF